MRPGDIRKAVVTWVLIGLNVAVFIVLELLGSTENGYFMYRHGAMLTGAVSEDGEYWRLFTCLFLHFGIMHLANNMLVLFAIGTILESGIGHARTLAVYLLSGVGANFFSYYLSLKKDEQVLSAGASGAVFGLMGAMIFAALFARDRIGALSLRQIILMLILSLYHGVNEAVDDAAHISGLALGFLLAFFLLLIPDRQKPADPTDAAGRY